MEQRHTGHCLTASAFRIHRHRNTADIVHGHRLRRKEDRGIERGYHPQVIGGVRMVRKTVGVLGVGMRVGYGITLIIMRMDKQRIAHVEPYEQGYEKAVQKAVFSQPFYHNTRRQFRKRYFLSRFTIDISGKREYTKSFCHSTHYIENRCPDRFAPGHLTVLICNVQCDIDKIRQLESFSLKLHY